MTDQQRLSQLERHEDQCRFYQQAGIWLMFWTLAFWIPLEKRANLLLDESMIRSETLLVDYGEV